MSLQEDGQRAIESTVKFAEAAVKHLETLRKAHRTLASEYALKAIEGDEHRNEYLAAQKWLEAERCLVGAARKLMQHPYIPDDVKNRLIPLVRGIDLPYEPVLSEATGNAN